MSARLHDYPLSRKGESMQNMLTAKNEIQR